MLLLCILKYILGGSSFLKPNLANRVKQYTILAVLIVIIYSIPLALFNLYPFGNYSLGIVDFKTQYLPFFTYFRENFLTNPLDFFYSPNMGLGDSMLGVYSYYLASPLNFLLFLFPVKNLELGIYTILMIKFILMGVFSSLYLEKFKLTSHMNFLLAISYALSGYATVNFTNPMWLDAMFLLPLLFIAIDKIIETKKIYPFVIIYSLMVFSNFYIAFMTGILTIIYFLYSYFITNTSFSLKHFIKRLVLFGLSAIISAGINILPLITTLHSLSSSKAEDTGIVNTAVFDNPLDLISKFYIGSNGSNQISQGLPNIFLPSIFISLLILFFGIKKISKREKIITGLLIGSLWSILYLPITNFVLHGLSYPIWFQYRYSFFVSLFLIIIGARVLEHLTELNITRKKLFSISGIYILMLVYFIFKEIDYVLTFNMIASTLYMLITLFVLNQIQKETNAKIFNRNNLMFIIVLLSVMELAQNNLFTSMNIYSYSAKSDVSEQQTYGKSINKVYQDIDDTEFYRTETTFASGFNDNMLSGIKGISGFNSTLNSGSSELLRKTGYAAMTPAFMQNQYVGGNLFTDSILNIKYVFSADNNDFYDLDEEARLKSYKENTFKENHHENVNDSLKIYDKSDTTNDEIKLYTNDSAIGYGWVQNGNTDFKYSSDMYANMNTIYKGIFNTKENLYTEIPYKLTLNNLDYDKKTKIYKVKDKEKDANILITYDNPENRYIYTNGSVIDTINLKTPFDPDELGILTYNGAKLAKPITTTNSSMVLTPDKTTGNQIEIEILKETPLTEFEYSIYVYEMLDTNYVKEQLASIKNTLNIEEFTNTSIKGTVISDKDDNKLIMSVPYDSYWSVKVNGKSVETTKEVNSLLGVPLEKGENTVELTYTVTNIKMFLIITLLSIIFVCFYSVRTKKD